MYKKITFFTIIIALLISISPMHAQKKGGNSNADPEFQAFWKEFIQAAEKNNKNWFIENTLFPFIVTGECGYMPLKNNKEDFSAPSLDKKEIKKLKKLKLSEAYVFQKDDTRYSFSLEDSDFNNERNNYEEPPKVDFAKHIPNGSTIVEITLMEMPCSSTFGFVYLNNRYYYFYFGTCCEATD